MADNRILNLAILIATEKHSGKDDLSGMPYILHPLRVMINAQKAGHDIYTQCVAVLHDVIEDTDVTLDDLKDYGFPDEVLRPLDLLTKRKGEDYLVYIKRIMQSERAKVVKILDLEDNMDIRRLPFDKLGWFSRKKMAVYARAYKMLKFNE